MTFKLKEQNLAQIQHYVKFHYEKQQEKHLSQHVQEIEDFNLQNMKILSTIKEAIKISDFFFSSQMLRYKYDVQYRTVSGGLLSLGIIITITISFASMVIDTFNLSAISFQTITITQDNPPPSMLSTAPGSNFMFGLEIWGYNLTANQSYFDVSLYLENLQGPTYDNLEELPLEACTIDHWKDYPTVADKFNEMGIGGWLCPTINSTFDIFGKYSSGNQQQITIQVNPCQNSSNNSLICATQEQINSMIQSSGYGLYFTVYFINPVINLGSLQPINYYLEDRDYVMFGTNMGSQAYIYMTDYTIETDQSIWPYTDIKTKSGVIAQDVAIYHPYQPSQDNPTYAIFYICKSSKSVVYTRQVRKLTDNFAFIGGLIGAISAMLFFVKYYTMTSFELKLALNMFKSNTLDQDHPPPPQHFTLFDYIPFVFYKIGKKIGLECRWPNMQYFYQCQQQILKQLDVSSLLKRIMFLEILICKFVQTDQIDCSNLQKLQTASQIRNFGKKMSCLRRQEEIKIQEPNGKNIVANENQSNYFDGESNLNSDNVSQVILNRPNPKNTIRILQINKIKQLEDLKKKDGITFKRRKLKVSTLYQQEQIQLSEKSNDSKKNHFQRELDEQKDNPQKIKCEAKISLKMFELPSFEKNTNRTQ